MKRVVVTGVGLITPLGNDAATTWQNAIAGHSGIRLLDNADALGLEPTAVGEVRDFSPEGVVPAKQLRHMERGTQMAAVAALEAVSDAGLSHGIPLGSRTGIAFGASLGGSRLIESQAVASQEEVAARVRPYTLPNMLADAPSGHIAIILGATGPNMAVLSASASGASAIGEAAEIIRRGDADVMVAGASEAPLTPVRLATFAAMRAMARPGDNPAAACKPFDLNRTGFVVAEGAGALVLESLDHARARGVPAYAELAGYGSADDAFDMVASDPEGGGTIRSMIMALHKADLSPQAIGYINAHGTASRMNDRVETLAIKQVFGPQAYGLAISSTKSMTGHLMGAAGAVEAALSVLALHHALLPPTINYEAPDPECDLDYVPNIARPVQDLSAVLSQSIGLGGHNASLIFRRL